MMRLLFSGVLVCLMSTAMAAADPVGQPPRDVTIGSRLPPPRDLAIKRGEATSIRGAYNYAQCVVVHRGGAVRRFLDSTTAEDERKADREMTMGELTCNGIPGMVDVALSRQISMPLDIERGVMAEAYLEEHARHFGYPPLPPSKIYLHPWSQISGRPAAVDEMAICVAQTDPQRVSTLLATVPATPGEASAIRAMLSTLGTCLVSGTSLNANAQSLRAELAEALYHRWATAQSPTEIADTK